MGNRAKRELEARAMVEAIFGDGLVKAPPPDLLCRGCGAPAKWSVSAPPVFELWCAACLPAKWRGPGTDR